MPNNPTPKRRGRPPRPPGAPKEPKKMGRPLKYGEPTEEHNITAPRYFFEAWADEKKRKYILDFSGGKVLI